MESLLDEVEEADLGKSFRAKLRGALRAYRKGHSGAAESLARAFISRVAAQRRPRGSCGMWLDDLLY